jgi:hypothetical protein
MTSILDVILFGFGFGFLRQGLTTAQAGLKLCVAQAGLELIVLLPQSPKYWYYRQVPFFS